MRAAWYDRLGPARDVLQVGEMAMPEAAPGEVRVRLAASGVNPSDVKRRGGARAYTMDYPRVVPNSDGAGTVDQVGAGVDESWLGRRVWLYNGQRGGRAFGTAAEYIALDAGLVSPLPDGLSFEEGACLGVPAMTAHVAVFCDGRVTGKTVLVTGGAGAVGHYAIQLAKWGGARVIATVSGPEKAAHAKAAGADAIVNYRSDDPAEAIMAATGGAGVDRICEVDFGGNLATMLKVLKQNGHVATYASAGDDHPRVPFYALMAKAARIKLIILNSETLAMRKAAQRDVTRFAAEGRSLHTVAARFPLAQIAEAHEAVEAGTKLGTVVVQPEV